MSKLKNNALAIGYHFSWPHWPRYTRGNLKPDVILGIVSAPSAFAHHKRIGNYDEPVGEKSRDWRANNLYCPMRCPS